ncbi:MAG: hypothetical protein ACFFBP_23790 [Promethearchaeota archaeon]
MSTKKPEKKNNFLGFRLSINEIHKLEKIAKIENRSRSLIAKQAVKNWINLESFRKTNNMMIITKSMFYQLLSQVNEELLNSLVSETAELLADITRFNVPEKMDIKNFNIYSKNIIRFLSNSGLRWFNTIDFILKKDKLIIKGLHDLDESFSEFFILMIEYYLKTFFNFKLSSNVKDISSNLINLEYIIQNYE